MASFRQALELKPHHKFLYGTWVHTKMNLCDWSDADADFGEITKRIECDENAALSFCVLAISSSRSVQRKAAEIYVRAMHPVATEPVKAI